MLTVIRQHPDRFAAEIDGDILMMDAHSGDYFGLNQVGSFIWKLVDTPHSVAEVCAAVRSTFAVDAAQCEADIQDFLQQMIEANLLLANPPDTDHQVPKPA